MKLKDKSIVVTGASSGMGKAIVELFVKEGANVIAVARRKERLEALAESLKDEAGQVLCGRCIPAARLRRHDRCSRRSLGAT